MILWINGAFGAGKTAAAEELHRRLPDSFIFDPEEAGFYIRRNAPAAFSQGDFQDIPQWRAINEEMLAMLAAAHRGTVIVPMTVTNPAYYREMTASAADAGAEIRHFVLYAERETILRRLRRRSLGMISREVFAVEAIDRCLDAFNGEMRGERIVTDGITAAEAAEEIARRANLTLAADNRGFVRRLLDGWLVTLRHIR